MLVYNSQTGAVTTSKIRKPGEQEIGWIRLHSAEPDVVKHVLQDIFQCHPLLVEDCIKLNQRPKLDRYKHQAFVTFYAIEKKNAQTPGNRPHPRR